MTNHFTQKLCKQFDEMGLESGSGLYRCKTSSVDPKKETKTLILNGDEWKSYNKEIPQNWDKIFTLQDILMKDNLIKIFDYNNICIDCGKEFEVKDVTIENKTYKAMFHCDCGNSYDPSFEPSYRYHAHQILDKFIDGGLSAIEEYISNYLKEQNDK